ncbi:MAG: helix-turn-helix domain-containing protein [Fusobacteriaceae bacterium]
MEDRTVDTLVKRVRKKIGIYSEHIKTIRGVGYSFDEV